MSWLQLNKINELLMEAVGIHYKENVSFSTFTGIPKHKMDNSSEVNLFREVGKVEKSLSQLADKN